MFLDVRQTPAPLLRIPTDPLSSTTQNAPDLLTHTCHHRNLPVGAAAFGIILLSLRVPQAAAATNNKSAETTQAPFLQRLAQLDFAGIVLVIGAVCCLLLALQWGGQTKAWSSADVVGLLVGSVLLLAAFGAVQWRKGDAATIPLRIFGQRSIFMGAMYSFFLEMAIYAVRSALSGGCVSVAGIR